MTSSPTLSPCQPGTVEPAQATAEKTQKRRGAFLVALCSFILLDTVIFRSGWYQRFTEPHSSIGMYRFQRDQALLKEKQSRHLVAFLGDSRMMEGFSLKQFDKIAVGTSYTPVLLAVQGSTLRVWYYLFKQVDADKKMFDAIVVPMCSYSNVDEYGDSNERALDVNFLGPFLSFSESMDLLNTYTDPNIKSAVLLGALFKSYAYRLDVRDFLMHPKARLQAVRSWKRAGASSIYKYPGNATSLLGMRLQDGRYLKGTSMTSQAAVDRLNHRVFDPLPAQTGSQKRYNEFWLNRLIDACAKTGTKVVLFKVPTDAIPRHIAIPDERSTIISLSRRKNVFVLSEKMFNDLEASQYFWDDLHLNKDGRTKLTDRLASSVLRVLGDPAEGQSLPP